MQNTTHLLQKLSHFFKCLFMCIFFFLQSNSTHKHQMISHIQYTPKYTYMTNVKHPYSILCLLLGQCAMECTLQLVIALTCTSMCINTVYTACSYTYSVFSIYFLCKQIRGWTSFHSQNTVFLLCLTLG